MSANFRAAIDVLTARFDNKIFTNPAVLVQHGTSEGYHEVLLPDAVLFPETEQDVIDAVRLCTPHNMPIIGYGAGTSLEGHFTPIRGGLCVDFSRMNKVLRISPEDMDCTVQPGVTREQLNTELRETGIFFPIDPGANATIGGMTSTRASGTNAVRYGTMRENVLSVRAVTAGGKVIQTGQRARKSAAGYDLTRLFVGAEGTLGLITEITLRLHPVPTHIASAICPFDTLKGAVDTVVASIQCGIPLARIELLDALQIEAVNRRAGTSYAAKSTLFFEFHGTEAHVAEQVALVESISEALGGGDFQWASKTEERTRLWRARHEAYYAALALRKGSTALTTDVCVPISRLTETILETQKDIQASNLLAPILGHVGDGNFHVICLIDPNDRDELARVHAFNDRLVSRAIAAEGTCTGEHGIGLGKMGALEAELGDAISVMRSIKMALDPANLFNPGKIFRAAFEDTARE